MKLEVWTMGMENIGRWKHSRFSLASRLIGELVTRPEPCWFALPTNGWFSALGMLPY